MDSLDADAPEDPADAPPRAGLTRNRVSVFALAVITLIVLVLCWRMTEPFVSALVWAVALAIVANGLHRRIARRVRRPNLSAGLTTALLAAVLLVLAAAIAPVMVEKAREGWEHLRSDEVRQRVDDLVRDRPTLARAVAWATKQMPSSDEMAKQLAPRLQGFLTGSMWGSVQLLVTFFALFYLLRDRELALRWLRSVLPLTARETSRIFKRVAEVVRASVLGTVLIAALQGLLGGLMFWWLGLPAPMLWGLVMFVLSILPVLGAAIVWIPAAGLLLLEGSWEKALILTLWGSIVVALVDNLLYPVLIGKQLRLHTLPAFIAIVGGLVAFGATGLVIGPLALAMGVALLEVWRRRLPAH
ncbi:AI-2E family transporter [Rhizobacter sp. OV335]|uniref:AI-2E family transporter n=1 Tax=Rhizobacter sp. OV335 TaxID=1500264 RepID=UPI000918395F|nr:AI-2E family transporter [Rhizobacter sp. OV335]SHN33896.1 Predicted PurR-regulated permease PerM [Rhizobacter sp. OV335]